MGQEDPLEKGKATHSSILAWRIPWTVAYQAPPSMRFSRQEYWSGLPFPSPEDLPDPGIEPRSPAFQADALTSEPPGKPLKANLIIGRLLLKVKLTHQPQYLIRYWVTICQDYSGKRFLSWG